MNTFDSLARRNLRMERDCIVPPIPARVNMVLPRAPKRNELRGPGVVSFLKP